MIRCANCGELIGDDLQECPFCKHQLTNEERKNAVAENEQFHQAAVENAIREYGKRMKIQIVIAIIMFVIALAGMITIALLNLDVIWGVLLILIVLVVFAFGVIKYRIGLCPYCESLMGRGMVFRTHCPRCGGRVR